MWSTALLFVPAYLCMWKGNIGGKVHMFLPEERVRLAMLERGKSVSVTTNVFGFP